MEKQDNSYPTKSLFAFCGSALIAKQLKEAKVLSDLVLSMTGNTTNGMDLVAETKMKHMDPISCFISSRELFRRASFTSVYHYSKYQTKTRFH